MHRPLIIGITGGIGSGKSTLSKKLRTEGYLVYDCDIEARRLQNEHPLIRQQLQEYFGPEIYTDQGLNRKALANIVFGMPDLMSKVMAIVHPVVKEDFKKWIENRSMHKLLFMESAILFESGFEIFVDKVILMTASEEVRIRRVMKRDSITHEQVRARMSHQIPDEKKITRSDFVIYTDDNKPLVDKMKKILVELCEYKLLNC